MVATVAIDILCSHQKKILTIDDHVGVPIAGLTADARTISRWMRNECLSSRYGHDTPLPVSRMIADLGNKMQICTQVIISTLKSSCMQKPIHIMMFSSVMGSGLMALAS